MKIVLLSIDGLGLGAMEDTSIKANTWKTISDKLQSNELTLLTKIINESKKMKLDYIGADSFLGHLCMSGINVSKLQLEPLSSYKKEIINILQKHNLEHEVINGVITVPNKFIIYDNFEADPGLAINIAGTLDTFSFQKQLEISKEIRTLVSNPRVITFSANDIKLNNYLDHPISLPPFYGIQTTKSGVYNDSFVVQHLPAIDDFQESIQEVATKKGYEVYSYGKFANIINIKNNNKYFKYENIDIKDMFEELQKNIKSNSLHCINVQQTDLAGHEGDVMKYIEALKQTEIHLQKLLNLEDVITILVSDHGNDPQYKDGKHTREYVPFWTNSNTNVQDISVLSDVKKYIESIL